MAKRVTTSVPAGVPERVEEFLVPLDASEFSQRAVPVAASFANLLAAGLCLFSAVPAEDEVAARKEQLTALPLRIGDVHTTVVVDPDPAGAVHEGLERSRGAVACMATHGRGRSAGFVGSVATEVVARGRDPLIAVGPNVGEFAPWLPKRYEPSDVVACVDETPASEALLPIARGWARLLGAELVVATVAEPVPQPLTSGPVRRRFGPDGDAAAVLQGMVARVLDAPQGVHTRVIYDPISPASGIWSYLRDRPARLVVLCSRAHRGLTRIVFGSVAAPIVYGSPSPVLVVPRPDTK